MVGLAKGTFETIRQSHELHKLNYTARACHLQQTKSLKNFIGLYLAQLAF